MRFWYEASITTFCWRRSSSIAGPWKPSDNRVQLSRARDRRYHSPGREDGFRRVQGGRHLKLFSPWLPGRTLFSGGEHSWRYPSSHGLVFNVIQLVQLRFEAKDFAKLE
eukprot:654742-Rhodomonas_salina.1